MTFDFLPPQAYTKETLLKAYNWLQSQSDQVKELATTPDQLVSLFLKSTRLGQDSLQRYTNSNTIPSVQITPPTSNGHADKDERPSLQNFKSELKNLAGMMGDLEKPPTINPNAPIPSYQGPAGATPYASNGSSVHTSTTNAYVSAPTQNNHVSSPAINASSAVSYDEMTQNLIREVKNELNLSSDTEALRMLVKIGYQKVRSLYK
jgi:hypothetical protein